MQTEIYFPKPIDLKELKKDALNHFFIDEQTEVVVLCDDDGFSVIRDFCPHMGAPLSEGKRCSNKKQLQCPWHGYYFDAKDGKYLSNPNDAIFGEMKKKYKSYKPEKTPKWQLKVYNYEIKDGKLYVCRGATA